MCEETEKKVKFIQAIDKKVFPISEIHYYDFTFDSIADQLTILFFTRDQKPFSIFHEKVDEEEVEEIFLKVMDCIIQCDGPILTRKKLKKHVLS